MSLLGTPENPLVVAVVGSGPSGFYAAEHLFKQLGSGVRVMMIERLPTPFGLVRGGVAPDHQKIKSVTKVYDRIAQREASASSETSSSARRSLSICCANSPMP